MLGKSKALGTLLLGKGRRGRREKGERGREEKGERRREGGRGKGEREGGRRKGERRKKEKEGREGGEAKEKESTCFGSQAVTDTGLAHIAVTGLKNHIP